MEIVKVKYEGINGKRFEGRFIKIGKEHYVPIQILANAAELPHVISEESLTELELLK